MERTIFILGSKGQFWGSKIKNEDKNLFAYTFFKTCQTILQTLWLIAGQFSDIVSKNIDSLLKDEGKGAFKE